MASAAPRHRPKRATDDFLRQPLGEQDGGARRSKKPRFDARNPSTLGGGGGGGGDDDDDPDAVLELDEIGNKGAQAKRNAVELDGYDSDSSDGNFDQRAEQRARDAKKHDKGKAKSKAEEENDMFADLEEDADGNGEAGSDDEAGAGKKRKEVRFLDQSDIVGQVASSKSGGHVSADFRPHGPRGSRAGADSDGDSDVDDDQRGLVGDGDDDAELGAGAKKKHAPRLDAFNMANEAEEGAFDESGNFVRNAADPFAVHDAWLDGAGTKAEMRKAREAETRRADERRRAAVASDAVSTESVLGTLIGLLHDGETVLEALARLGSGGGGKKKTKSWHKNRRRADVDMDEGADGGSDQAKADDARRAAVEAITGAADYLLTEGQADIYEAERALLQRQYRRETGGEWREKKEGPGDGDDRPGDDTSVPDRTAPTWHYRWADARDGGGLHGPYDAATLRAWREAGYFEGGVEFRRDGDAGDTGHAWAASFE